MEEHPLQLRCKTIFVFISLLAPIAGQCEVYKFVDEDGVINYTSKRPSDTSFSVLDFPCYASDPDCSKADWNAVPLNTRAYTHLIAAAAEQFSVDSALIRAIIHAESAFNPEAQSPKGAQGLMQLMPANQDAFQIIDAFDPVQNIAAGTQLLAQLVQRYDSDMDSVLAAYNAGETAVNRYGGVPPYPETTEYLRRVKILYKRYREFSG
jgi:soluble lytic murein transglycosylase-like protein